MSLASTQPSRHPWKFHRIAGLDQVAIENGADLLALGDLDQKLWVALACPVKGLELDEKTLTLIDSDSDGRIRVPELLAVIKWGAGHLKDAGELLADKDSLNLSALDTDKPAGKAALASARRALAALGKADATSISLGDVTDPVRIFAGSKFNGDGVVTEATMAEAPELQAAFKDITGTVGAVPDRSGAPGLDQGKIDAFFAAAAARVAWLEQGASDAVLSLGAGTSAAAEAVVAVRAKLDDYFARARLAGFDARAIAALNRSETEYLNVAAQDLIISLDEVAAFPVARIVGHQPLSLTDGLNPAWAPRVATLRKAAVTPIFDAEKATLEEAEWEQIKARVAAYEAWAAAPGGTAVAAIATDRLEALLASDVKARLSALVADDTSHAAEFNALTDLEKLLRLRRDLGTLLRNFVNFTDFYSPANLAIFQAGSLYLDSRTTEFCIQVAGPSPLAAMSRAYIAYCDCKRAGSPPMKIAACFTQGDSDYLFVGRHGLFYDRQGRDWDATITSVVENPISVLQAFWLPYKKAVRFFEEQVAKRAAAADTSSTSALEGAANKAIESAATGKKPDAKPKFEVGTVAALGVGLGAIGSLLGGFVAGFLGLGFYMPLGVLGILLLISGPSMLIAWIKLRQRTLGPLLEANGWAINGRVRINVPFGSQLTERATLPPGASRSLDDPYADKATIRRTRLLIVLVVVAIAAAIYIRWDRVQNGHYFWQPAPAVTETTPATNQAPLSPEAAPAKP